MLYFIFSMGVRLSGDADADANTDADADATGNTKNLLVISYIKLIDLYCTLPQVICKLISSSRSTSLHVHVHICVRDVYKKSFFCTLVGKQW